MVEWWQGIPISRGGQEDITGSDWAAIEQRLPGIKGALRGCDHTPAAGRLRAARAKNDVTRRQARPRPVSARSLFGDWLLGFMVAFRRSIGITQRNVVRDGGLVEVSAKIATGVAWRR